MTTKDTKISDIYQHTNREEPPAHLDNAILKASRQAIDNKPRARAPFSGRWPVPVSMAAVVIVAVIIVPIVLQETSKETNFPATESDEISDQLLPDSETPAGREPNFQNLITPTEHASPLGLMQSPPGPVMAEPPVSDIPATSSVYEKDSLIDQSSLNRVQEQKESTQPLRKERSTASKSLIKKQSAIKFHTPEVWISHIKELLAANEPEKAKSEMKALKQAYPAYNIEPGLNYLLD